MAVINDNDGFASTSEAIKVRRFPADRENNKQTKTLEQSGWYYDQQLLQPLTSVRLKSNTFANWVENKNCWEFQPFPENSYEETLATSILAEDFQVEVTNNWVDNDIGDMIGGALNMFKTASPYLGVMQDALNKIKKSQAESGKQAAAENRGLKVTSAISDMVDYFGEGQDGAELIKSIRSAANGHFMTQGCSFTYYGGTGVNFGNLGMRFTIFPTYDYQGNWRTVQEQISLLLPYCIGVMQDVPKEVITNLGKVFDDLTDLAGSVNKSVGNFINAVKNVSKAAIESVAESAVGKTVENKVNHYIKWQAAPGGYDLNKPESIDTILPGTLCLEIGSQYKIESLVISNINFNFSKQLVKNPEYFSLQNNTPSVNPEDSISPLYCDVNLLLRPTTKYSSVTLMKFLNGNVESRKQTATNVLNSLKEMQNYV